MIMPLPKASWACATVPFSPGTTRCFSNPKALHNQSIAAAASRYRIAGMTVEIVFLAPPAMMTPSEAVNLSMGNTDQRRASFETAASAASSG
jgi:hypothetical protein